MGLTDDEKFERARSDAEEIYGAIGEAYCPYLKERVIFNAKGLEHIKFKRIRQARSRRDQYMRLRLISLAPKILKESHTLQGLCEMRTMERERTHNRWDVIMRNAIFYEFIAVIRDVRVRVIVKEVIGGPKYFWSIIPFWRMNEMGKRMMHNGRPETD